MSQKKIPFGDYQIAFDHSRRNPNNFFQLEKCELFSTAFDRRGGAQASSRYYAHYADYAAFLLGVGSRPGEAAGLLWENVDPDFVSVYLGQSFSRGIMSDIKTKESRTINLSPSIIAMLKRRIETQRPQPSDLVFFTPTGLPINDRNFRSRAWTKVLLAAGVKYRSPYTSRRTAASHALASGQDHVSVARALGNSPKVLYDHYVDIIESRPVFVDFD